MRSESVSKAEYARIHYWLKVNYGVPTMCSGKECSGKSKYYTWALIHDKKYEKKRENFVMLCKSCHSKYDITEEGRRTISLKKLGKKRPDMAEWIKKNRVGMRYPSAHKKVYVYNKNMELLIVCKSNLDASKYVGCSTGNVTMVCNKNYPHNKSVKGYVLSYQKLKKKHG